MLPPVPREGSSSSSLHFSMRTRGLLKPPGSRVARRHLMRMPVLMGEVGVHSLLLPTRLEEEEGGDSERLVDFPSMGVHSSLPLHLRPHPSGMCHRTPTRVTLTSYCNSSRGRRRSFSRGCNRRPRCPTITHIPSHRHRVCFLRRRVSRLARSARLTKRRLRHSTSSSTYSRLRHSTSSSTPTWVAGPFRSLNRRPSSCITVSPSPRSSSSSNRTLKLAGRRNPPAPLLVVLLLVCPTRPHSSRLFNINSGRCWAPPLVEAGRRLLQ